MSYKHLYLILEFILNCPNVMLNVIPTILYISPRKNVGLSPNSFLLPFVTVQALDTCLRLGNVKTMFAVFEY
jgi:hypothetical protein